MRASSLLIAALLAAGPAAAQTYQESPGPERILELLGANSDAASPSNAGAEPLYGRTIVSPKTGGSIVRRSQPAPSAPPPTANTAPKRTEKAPQQARPQRQAKPKPTRVARIPSASDALAPCTVYSENHIDFQTRFALGSSRIPPSFDRFIVDLAAALKTEPSIAIDISGHTDVSGGDDINVPLSVERALSVANRLVELGIDPTRLRAVGHASTRLCYPDAPRHPGNRRVTIARR